MRCSQDDKKGHSGGPIHKKDKSHGHQPYRGKSTQSSASGTTPQYRAIPKPGMGLVCFCYGDAHRCVECQWTGRCSLCSQNHKDVVCRKNPNLKVCWELVSTPASGGVAHMLTTTEQHFLTPLALPYLPTPFHPQYLMRPNSTPMTPYSGAPRLPSAPTVSSLPWTTTPTGAMPGCSSVGVSGVYALPSMDGRERGDVVTGTISVDSFHAHTLFDSGASFSFVSDAFVAHAHLFRQKISQPIVVNSAKCLISSTLVYPGCSIFLADETFVANLVVIPVESFDVILGMDWLSQYRAIISCFWNTVPLQAPSGREVIFIGSALKYSLALLYHLFPNRWVRKSRIIFAMMDNGEPLFL
jgi:hypothetical protein